MNAVGDGSGVEFGAGVVIAMFAIIRGVTEQRHVARIFIGNLDGRVLQRVRTMMMMVPARMGDIVQQAQRLSE